MYLSLKHQIHSKILKENLVLISFNTHNKSMMKFKSKKKQHKLVGILNQIKKK